ncbi:MAG TPA: hypothetical protein VFW49_01140 [Fluviicoccus sp.]|nr:hypothetical protein [Fluviicoccus sp.]
MKKLWRMFGLLQVSASMPLMAEEMRSEPVVVPLVLIDYSDEAVTLLRMQGLLFAAGVLAMAAVLLVLRLASRKSKPVFPGDADAGQVTLVWSLFFLLIGGFMGVAALRVWVWLQAAA